jgi:RNA polymerase sigma factor for flagellar operon FliA
VTADADELAAFGRQGLVEAAARFDPNRGEDFRRFAYFRVKGAMLDGIRKMGTWSRRGYERIALLRAAHVASSDQADEAGPVGALGAREAAERLQKHMASMVTAMTTGVFGQPAHQGDGEVQAVHAGSDAEQQLADKQMTELVRRAIDELPPPEDMVVRRFYVDGDKMDDIAEDLGHSRSWVSRVHTRALKRLGARLRTITP